MLLSISFLKKKLNKNIENKRTKIKNKRVAAVAQFNFNLDLIYIVTTSVLINARMTLRCLWLLTLWMQIIIQLPILHYQQQNVHY